MRALCLALLAVVGIGCSSSPPPHEPGVRVELAKTDLGVQPPVFRWDAPVAARVTVQRGPTVVWEIAEADQPGQRGPILSPLTYGTAVSASSRLRVLVPPEPLLPQRVYSVTVIGYDGTVFEGTFSVNERISVR
ncbi:MAG: hypothetical protein Rubg2KO_17460 [Rubricoccaceae bacterium]